MTRRCCCVPAGYQITFVGTTVICAIELNSAGVVHTPTSSNFDGTYQLAVSPVVQGNIQLEMLNLASPHCSSMGTHSSWWMSNAGLFSLGQPIPARIDCQSNFGIPCISGTITVTAV